MGDVVVVPAVSSGVASQQAQQAALVSLLAGPLDNAWQLLDPQDPATMTEFLAAVVALTQRFGQVSSVEAAKYYATIRKDSGIAGAYTVRPAPTAPIDKITTSIRWATQTLWGPNPDLAIVQSTVLGVTEKNVLDSGRMTIIDAVHSDRKAKGWARGTSPGACSFCAMLAVRGAVYRSEKTASFESHNNCHCFPIPVFNAYEPSAQVREWQQIYKESTRGVHGAANMRKAFRHAYDAKSSK